MRRTRTDRGPRRLLLALPLMLTWALAAPGAPAQSRAVPAGPTPAAGAAPLPPPVSGSESTKDCAGEAAASFQTLDRVAGRIKSVRTADDCAGKLKAVEVVIEDAAAKGAAVTARLAPEWYLQRAGMRLAAGDEVVLRGAWSGEGAARMLLVSEVHKGRKRASLRNGAGRPRWRGRSG